MQKNKLMAQCAFALSRAEELLLNGKKKVAHEKATWVMALGNKTPYYVAAQSLASRCQRAQ